MKIYYKILSLVIILNFCCSCDDIQKNVEDKAKDLRKEAERTIDHHMDKVDSTIQHLDTTIQEKIDEHLQKADTILDQIIEN